MRLSLLLALFILGVSVPVLAQDNKIYSLEDCIEYALENNEQLSIAGYDRDISDAQVGEVRAQGLPQINGFANYTNNLEVQTSFITDFISPAIYGVLLEENLLPDGTQIPEPQTFPAQFGTDNIGQVGLSATQLIFNGSYFVGLQAARTVRELSRRQEERTQIDVISNVSRAYYLVLVTRENLELLGANFSRLDTLLYETTLLYENGFAEKIDINRIQIQRNNVKTQLQNTADMLITSVSILKFQMGMPLDEQLRLSGDLKQFSFEPIVTSQVEFTPVDRIEYKILKTNEKLTQLNIKNYRSQYLPTLNANFDLGYTAGTASTGDMFNFDGDTWFKYNSWGLALNIPIFDGMYKRYKNQQNKIQLSQIQLGLRQTTNNIKQEVQTSNIQYNNAIRNMDTQEENMDLAREVYEVSVVKYEEGLGSNLEVIEADTSLKEAQTNYYNALYDAIIAKIDLLKALGRLHKS